MSGICGIINRDGSPADKEFTAAMTALASHRGPDGIYHETYLNAGFGYAKMVRSREEAKDIQPVWLPDKSCAVVADARIYNRDPLLAKLGGCIDWYDRRASDAALILAAYLRWGTELLQEIDGDFSFAVWDRDRNRVFAARDPFGVKPFFYYAGQKHFIFASEPKQILLHKDVSKEPDKLIVGEYLFRKFEEVGRTFYRDIRRIRPAHYILADKNGIQDIRYWNPDPERETLLESREEYLDRFRELFLESVRKRLGTDYPVVAQLSGGVDSSSIVSAAGAIYNAGRNGLPDFRTVSGIYPGLDCDESEYIEAVIRGVPFDNVMLNPLHEPLCEGLISDIEELDSPYANLQRGTFIKCAEVINKQGARTLLTGLGGDELTHEEFYLRDLAVRGMYLTLLIQSWKSSRTSWNSFFWLFADALRAVAPAFVKELYGKSVGKSRWSPPWWAERDFAEFYMSCPEAHPLPEAGFKSRTQEAAFQFLNFPTMCWALEALECHAANRGFEVTHPFLDRPLAEYVLSIPFEMRIPEGRWKYLLRSGLSSELPDEVIERGRKTMFTTYNNYLMEHNISSLKNMIFSDDQWKSGYFISRNSALSVFNTYVNHNNIQSLFAGDLIWKITNLELWNRAKK